MVRRAHRWRWRFGFAGFARTAYVALLVPYALAALFATANNLLLSLP